MVIFFFFFFFFLINYPIARSLPSAFVTRIVSIFLGITIILHRGKHRLLRKVCKNTDNGALTLIVNRHKLFLVDPSAQEEWHKSPTPASFLPSDASAPQYSCGSPLQIQTYPTAVRVQEYPKMKQHIQLSKLHTHSFLSISPFYHKLAKTHTNQ